MAVTDLIFTAFFNVNAVVSVVPVQVRGSKRCVTSKAITVKGSVFAGICNGDNSVSFCHLFRPTCIITARANSI